MASALDVDIQYPPVLFRSRGRGHGKECFSYSSAPQNGPGRGRARAKKHSLLNVEGELLLCESRNSVAESVNDLNLDNMPCSAKQKTDLSPSCCADENENCSTKLSISDGETEFKMEFRSKRPELICHRMDRPKLDSKTLIKVCTYEDSTPVEVDGYAFCSVSKVFKEMYEMSFSETDSSEVIRLQINHNILLQIVKWAELRYYEEYTPDPLDLKMEQKCMKYVNARDMQFLQQFCIKDICKLAQAAEFLEMEDLRLLCSKVIYQRLQGKKSWKIRKELHLVNDFTEDEENKVRKQNEWYVDLKTMKF